MKEIRTLEGSLHAGEGSYAIVLGRFNSFVTEPLFAGALDCLNRHGIAEDSVTVARVPGSWEIPLVARRLARSGAYDAVICLGAIIRGGTPHFDFVAAEAAKGIASASMETDVPIVFGVLTTDTTDQAVERAGVKAGNKGWDAAQTAIEMVSLMKQIPG
ncbi:MAG: 6,7-dimethyl-8-ribityllumazine synthase [Spirochaetota bacterium]